MTFVLQPMPAPFRRLLKPGLGALAQQTTFRRCSAAHCRRASWRGSRARVCSAVPGIASLPSSAQWRMQTAAVARRQRRAGRAAAAGCGPLLRACCLGSGGGRQVRAEGCRRISLVDIHNQTLSSCNQQTCLQMREVVVLVAGSAAPPLCSARRRHEPSTSAAPSSPIIVR